uniref:Reverse transcriptase domain-containing protein n=1 Tax=Astatotilapia calliptera TaxID=8154 RepID=A0A3P8Q9Z3_ASTCA
MLAHRVKQIKSSNLIPSIFDPSNNNKLTTSKKEINDIFTKYYQELYTSNGLVEEQRLSDFFSSIKIPSLSEDQRSILEGKITLIEVKQAIGSLRVVYTDPMATVITNGIMSPSFSLSRGTRQGSPLSPLIFALFLEPLAIALRECKKIRGVDLGQEEHKTFLYADDILLISTNPEQAVPAISSIIDSFSVISGYTINWSKSEAMPISKLCPPVMRSSWHFKWMPEGLTYLGIKLTPGLDNIMKVNISPVIQNIRSLLQNWVKINLSLLGRINLVKMIIAPKLQYFLHMLPIAVPHNLLKLYNTCVEGFVWAGKKPLFNRSKLYAAKESGGLALQYLQVQGTAMGHRYAPSYGPMVRKNSLNLLTSSTITTPLSKSNMKCIRYSSYHPKDTFKGIIKSQIIRFYRISSKESDLQDSISVLFRSLRKRLTLVGFSEQLKVAHLQDSILT